jgi:hypothetical protein
MRDQYAGDISDYIKFAFLRCLLRPEQTVGIGWYYLEGHDGRPDGRHREYLADSRWSALDPELHEYLKSVNSVATLEQLRIWNCGIIFHRETVPVLHFRQIWAKDMYRKLANADVVFVDPDNGISKANKTLRKSATATEITELCSSNRPVITIRFPHRRDSHNRQLSELHSMFFECRPVTLRTTVRVPNRGGGSSPRIRWFTLLNGTEHMLKKMHIFSENLNNTQCASAKVAV